MDGYYDSLLTLFDNMQAQGFLNFNARTLVVSAPTAAELLDKLEVGNIPRHVANCSLTMNLYSLISNDATTL